MEDDDSQPASVDTIPYEGPRENDSENLSDVDLEAEQMGMEGNSEAGSSNHDSVKMFVDASTQTTPYGPPPTDFPAHIFYVNKDGSGSITQI